MGGLRGGIRVSKSWSLQTLGLLTLASSKTVLKKVCSNLGMIVHGTPTPTLHPALFLSTIILANVVLVK